MFLVRRLHTEHHVWHMPLLPGGGKGLPALPTARPLGMWHPASVCKLLQAGSDGRAPSAQLQQSPLRLWPSSF